jgi:RHS repeat-associated protein
MLFKIITRILRAIGMHLDKLNKVDIIHIGVFNGLNNKIKEEEMEKTRKKFLSGLLVFLLLFCWGGVSTAGTTYYHHDVLGTTLAQSDESGNVVWWANYDPYGSKNNGNSEDTKPQRYTGKEFDDETDLYYFGARYYNPTLARFISVDPVRVVDQKGKINQKILSNPQRLNLYSYGLNNPYKFIDPDGLWTVSVGVKLNAALGLGGGGGTDVNFGYSKKDGISLSLTGSAQGGAIAGGGVFAGGSLTITDADNVNQLNGISYQVGRSGIGFAYGEGVFGNGYTGVAVGVGTPVIPSGYTAGSATAATTSAIFQFNKGVYSLGNTGTSSLWSSCDEE